MKYLNGDGSSSISLGTTGILTIVFVILKLTHVINWSWIWVLSPLWIGAIITILVIIVIIIIAAICSRN